VARLEGGHEDDMVGRGLMGLGWVGGLCEGREGVQPSAASYYRLLRTGKRRVVWMVWMDGDWKDT
jgi:hypothetical protein